MRKIISIPHHFDDYECMWNGVEDLYISRTGETLPPSFFFVLSGFGTFCYMKTEKAELKRMVALGDGRTQKMYEFLAPIVGFDYSFKPHKTFEQALKRAKGEIDAGYPCVLGALDMRHLPYYPKLYHGESIPFHYVLMVGYDEEAQCVFLHDCGRKDIQTLAFDELKKAWDCSYPGLSKPNTVCTLRMNSSKSKYEIAKEAFSLRREQFLHPAVSFTGCRGFEKLIKELPAWKAELSREDYNSILRQLVMFLGTVPGLPNALRGIDEADELPFGGGFDKAALVLETLGREYSDTAMTAAAEVFRSGAKVIEQLKDVIVLYLTCQEDRTDTFPELFEKVRDTMTTGFKLLQWAE